MEKKTLVPLDASLVGERVLSSAIIQARVFVASPVSGA